MAPRVTSSSTRAGRKPAKPPVVTTSKGRGNRSAVSTAKPTSGSNGKPPAAGARVTNASQRTNTGSARVTGSARPALPPGQRGGALATTTKPPAARPQLPGTKPPARLPGGTGGADSVRGSGVRTGQPGAARPALPAAATRAVTGAVKNAGMLRGGLIGAVGLAGADYVGRKAGEAIGTGIRNAYNAPKRGDSRPNSPGGRSAASKPSQPASNYEKLFDTKGGRGNYGLDKPTPVAPLPASVRQSSSGGGSGTPSRGGSTPSRSGSTSPARSSTPAAPAKPGQKFADFNPGRGTSKTNNPLMKDMIARMKDREDKAQSSAASKLTNKFNTNDNFSGEKVDGSKVDTKAKINSTTSEYDKKKRRYGG